MAFSAQRLLTGFSLLIFVGRLLIFRTWVVVVGVEMRGVGVVVVVLVMKDLVRVRTRGATGRERVCLQEREIRFTLDIAERVTLQM